MATTQELNFNALVDAGLIGAARIAAPTNSTANLPLAASFLLGLPVGSTVTAGVAAVQGIYSRAPLPGGVVYSDIDGTNSVVIVDIDGTNSPLIAY